MKISLQRHSVFIILFKGSLSSRDDAVQKEMFLTDRQLQTETFKSEKHK